MGAAATRSRALLRVVLCDDLVDTPVNRQTLTDELRERFGVEVVVLGRVCSDPTLLLGVKGTAPAVVVCRAGHLARAELIGSLHQAGVPFDNIDVISGDTAPDVSADAATAAAVLAVHAAIAGMSADPYPMVTAERRQPFRAVPRRAAFAPPSAVRLPMPTLSAASCRADRGCDLCVTACPAQAIRMTEATPVVDAAACTGCAGCVAACPIAAWRLAGFSTRQLAGRLNALLRADDLPPASGIVIRCQDAQTPPLLGTGWAELVVPSMESVTPAVLFQPLAHGAGSVHLAACDRPTCRNAARELIDLAAAALAATACPGAVTGTPAPIGRPAARSAPDRRPPLLELSEPVASLRAVGALSLRDVRVVHGRAASAEVTVDANRCSGCDACTRVCPTSALASRTDASGTWTLAYDPRRCVSCGLCAGACPEDAIHIQPVIDTRLLDVNGELPLCARGPRACPTCGDASADDRVRDAAASRLVAHAPAVAAVVAGSCGRCGPAAFGPDGLRADERPTVSVPSARH